MDNLDNNSNSVLYQWPHYYCSPFAGPPHHEYDDSYRHRDCFPPHDHPHRSLPHDHLPFCYGQPADNSSSRLMKTDKSLCLPSLQSTPVPAPSSTLSSPAAAADEKMTKPAPRTWKKPLDKPKRPLSAYNYFFQHHRSVVIDALKKKAVLEAAEEAAAESSGKKKKKKRHQRRSRGIGIGFAELAREVAFKWKKLESESKKEYEEQARLDKERYDKELDQWTLKTEKEDLEREEKERTQEEEQQQQVPEEAQVDEEEAKVVVAVRVESFGSSASMHNKSLLMADRVESFGSAYSMTSVHRSLIMAERVTSFDTSGGYSGVPPPYHNLARSAVMADRVESFSGRNVLIPQDRRHVRNAHIEVEEEEEDEDEAEAYAYENHNPYDDDSACEDHQDRAVRDADSGYNFYLDHYQGLSLSLNSSATKLATHELCGPNTKGTKLQDHYAFLDEGHYKPHRTELCSSLRSYTSHVRDVQKVEKNCRSSPQHVPSRLCKCSTCCERNVHASRTPTYCGEGVDVAQIVQEEREKLHSHPGLMRLTSDVSAWAEGFVDVATAADTQKLRSSAPRRLVGADDKTHDVIVTLNYKPQSQNVENNVKLPVPLMVTPFSTSSSRLLCGQYSPFNNNKKKREHVTLLPMSPKAHFYCSTEFEHNHSSYHYEQDGHWKTNKESMAPFVTPPPPPALSLVYKSHCSSPISTLLNSGNHPYRFAQSYNEPPIHNRQFHGSPGEHKIDKKRGCDSYRGDEQPLPYLPTWTDKKGSY